MSVELVCVKVKSKLRVRITTPGYLNQANCQFPRDLRVEGRRFEVPAHFVRLVQLRGKHFYSVPRGVAKVIDFDQQNAIQIYEDEDSSECAICLCEPKQMVFVPCGHYYCCNSCTRRLQKCPICRELIAHSIVKSELLVD
jgi:hypothetical protein